MDDKTNIKKGKNTLNSVIIVLILTVATKLLGFVREALIGSNFGTGVEADAYQMAQRITITIFMAIGAAITVSVVPIITKYYTKGENEKANKFINKVITFFLMLSAGITILVLFFAKEYTSIIAGGFTGERLALTIDFVKILFPSCMVIFAAYVIRAVLQSRESFIGYSIMSVPFNLFLILYLMFWVGDYGIYGLVVSTLIAWAFQLIIQIPFTAKDKMKYALDFKIAKDKDINKFFILFMPILFSTLIYSVSTIIDSRFASSLPEGRVSALNYGYGIYAAIAQTLIYSISAVLFPKLVDNFNVKEFTEFKVDVKNIINNIFYIMIPAQFGLIVLSRPFVEMVFMRGKFDINSANLTQSAFIFFSVGLVGFALQEIISKTYFSVNDTKIPTITAILSVILNIVLNIILIGTLGMKGLALATSISITFNAIVMYIVFQIKYGKWDNIEVIWNGTRVLAASLIMYFSVNYLLINLNKVIAISNNFVYNLVSLVVASLFGIVVYGLATYILKVKQTEELVEKIAGMIKRRKT
ncbi:MAG TPA: murein biosynthesis integral membrane protein MurJ [Clostridiales bacterium]|nr:MAG: murein biosynthesis integral membrane protein MurJ [Clostridiales bacterium GWD2_32_19]HCC07714.1 murein biosynthesis integral membrane protein MurJ [Clostridiales bacterium]